MQPTTGAFRRADPNATVPPGHGFAVLAGLATLATLTAPTAPTAFAALDAGAAGDDNDAMSEPQYRPKLILIAAVARNGGIGLDNELLVHLPEDLQHFKRTTLSWPIVMGRKTWESIGRSLPGRRNIVVTRNPTWQAAGAETAASLDAALVLAAGTERLFVIGGARLFAQALPLADELVLTEIDAELPADTYFPPWDRSAFVEQPAQAQVSGQGLGYRFVTYRRRIAT